MAVINEKGQQAFTHNISFYGSGMATGTGGYCMAYRWYKDGLYSDEIVDQGTIESLAQENPELFARIDKDLREFAEILIRKQLEAKVESENTTI